MLPLLSTAGTGPDIGIHAGTAPNADDSPEKTPTSTISRQIEIINALGLHLRAAEKFVSLARQFRADVRITYEGHTASGTSVLDMTTLAATCGTRLELNADGPGAGAVLEALTDLIQAPLR